MIPITKPFLNSNDLKHIKNVLSSKILTDGYYQAKTESIIKNHIIERLLPGENDKQASMQIIDIVDRSSKTSWSQNLAEFSHKISNTLREATQFNMEL